MSKVQSKVQSKEVEQEQIDFYSNKVLNSLGGLIDVKKRTISNLKLAIKVLNKIKGDLQDEISDNRIND